MLKSCFSYGEGAEKLHALETVSGWVFNHAEARMGFGQAHLEKQRNPLGFQLSTSSPEPLWSEREGKAKM